MEGFDGGLAFKGVEGCRGTIENRMKESKRSAGNGEAEMIHKSIASK